MPIFRIAGCAAAVIVLVVSVIWFSLPKADAKPDSIDGLYLERYEDHIDIGFNQFDDYVPLTNIETYYLPTYLPKGMNIAEKDVFDYAMFAEWQNTDNNWIRIQQNISGKIQKVSAEKSAVEYLYIKKSTGLFFCNNDLNNIMWSDGIYDFIITGNIDKKTLLKIAESLAKTEIYESEIKK